MSNHPYTSKFKGFRMFDGSSFGELTTTEWDFDGTESDVREFAGENLGSVRSVKDVGNGSFDVTLEDETEFRVYTKKDESDGFTLVLPVSGLTIGF